MQANPPVRLSGDLDVNSVDAALEVLTTAITTTTGPTVMVDLAEVTFADPSALSMLLDAKQCADAEGVEVVLLNVPQQMHRVLEITRLDSVFEIDDDGPDSARDAPSESA